MVIGDCNAHIAGKPFPPVIFCDEKLLDNKIDSKMILEFSSIRDFVVLNCLTMTTGTFTRMSGAQKSTMDFALCNRKLLDAVVQVIIFDAGGFSTGSDHYVMYLTLNLKTKTFFHIKKAGRLYYQLKSHSVFQRELKNELTSFAKTGLLKRLTEFKQK